MIEFIDTHTHIFTPEFNEDRDEVVQRALESGVSSLCLPSINEDSIEPILDLCHRYPGMCHAMIGLHPTDVTKDYAAVLDRMYSKLCDCSHFVAVGEIGLDFYWDDSYRREQIEAFRLQLDWAHKKGLPVAIHSRSAFDELYEIMDEYRCKGLSGVFHCFAGNEEEARRLLSFDGFYLGIGGVLTYKKSTLPAVLAHVPLERIVLETDSPYLAPVPMRGKRNESAYVPYIASRLADIYACSIAKVATVTTANAKRLFTKIAQ